MKRSFVVALCLTISLLGCSWTGQIKARAAFDMQCTEDKIDVVEISSFRAQYGARGCGKQATYVVREGQAILNSPITPIEQSAGGSSATPPPPAPPAK